MHCMIIIRPSIRTDVHFNVTGFVTNFNFTGPRPKYEIHSCYCITFRHIQGNGRTFVDAKNWEFHPIARKMFLPGIGGSYFGGGNGCHPLQAFRNLARTFWISGLASERQAHHKVHCAANDVLCSGLVRMDTVWKKACGPFIRKKMNFRGQIENRQTKTFRNLMNRFANGVCRWVNIATI